MSEFIRSIEKIILRDLAKLEKEIEQYVVPENLWQVEKQIANSAGNLCLHLCGNLRHYIGKNLGGVGYVRNREAEFSVKNLAKEELLQTVSATRAALITAFAALKEEELDQVYPENVLGEPMTTRFFLIHLAAHLAYHLGQINYHRRLIAS